MKRLLLHYPVLNVGGAEMSSLRMMRALADRGWTITLVLTTGGGNLEHSVDPRVEIVRLRQRPSGEKFVRARGVRARVSAFPDLLEYLRNRAIGGIRTLQFRYRQFEAAGVLLMGTSSRFVRRSVRARTRVQWIRNDLARADPTGRIAHRLAAAEPELDYFICVSAVARTSLIKAVPAAALKARVIYNILDPDLMRQRAGESVDPFPPRRDQALRILTVCRLKDEAKGLLRMVRVCRRLIDKGHKLEWYIVGDGPDRDRFKQAIDSAGLGDVMRLLGPLENPFPAYSHADLVAVLSHYEGMCGVINEARVLERPVIATRVSGVDEQLIDGINGIVVENDEDAILEGMARLVGDAALRDRLATGGYPSALLDDEAKVDQLEALLLSGGIPHE